MREDAHRMAAEGIEKDIATLQANVGGNHSIIELAWGAAFHWIAYGCQRKLQKHSEKHQGLAGYLDSLGEKTLADSWRIFEQFRIGGFLWQSE